MMVLVLAAESEKRRETAVPDVQAQFCAHSVVDYGLLRKVRDTERGKEKKSKKFCREISRKK
jgi:hypothetical protein